MSPFALGFWYGALASEASLWLRVGLAVLASLATFDLIQYLCCIRRWKRGDDRLEMPTLRRRERHLIVDSGTELNIVEIAFTRTLHVGPPYEDGTPQLAINMYVSTRDLREWVK